MFQIRASAVVLMAGAAVAQGGLIAEHNFNQGDGLGAQVAYELPGSDVSSFGVGGSNLYAVGNQRFIAKQFRRGAEFDASKFVQFTIRRDLSDGDDPAKLLVLEDFDFEFGITSGLWSTYGLRLVVSSPAGSETFTYNPADYLVSTTASTLFHFDVDFADITLAPNQTATFRWDFFGGASTSTELVFDNVHVNGGLTPAPGAIALLGLGGLVAMGRRRA